MPDNDESSAAVIRRLLVPLARASIAQGVSLGQLSELMKSALVEAAVDGAGEDASDSRVSLLTGLHRKDVRRLRSERPEPRRTALGARALVAQRWTSDPEYSTDGAPRPLDRAAFDALVKAARIDMAPGTVLQTMRDQGQVTAAAGLIRLTSAAILPQSDSAELLAAFAATLAPHLDAAVDNLLAAGDAPRQFDRALRYSHLSAESVDELTAAGGELAMAMLTDLSDRARVLQDRDRTRADATGHFVLGAFVKASPPESEA